MNEGSDLAEKSIRARLKDTESRIAKLLDLMETGNAAPSMVERLNVLDAEKSRLEDALRMEQDIRRFHIDESHILKYLDSMAEGAPRNPDTRRWLLESFVSRVVVTGDTIAVSLSYTDDRREFSIRERAGELTKDDELMALLADLGRLDGIELSDAAREMMDSLIDPDDDDDGPDDDSDGGPGRGPGPSGGGPCGRSTELSGRKSTVFRAEQGNSIPRQGSSSGQPVPPC